jgi:methionyl-tRNA formyltransferase
LRARILSIPRLGTLNAHMGLLPWYRGMNVAEWSAFNGDDVGCTAHLIDEGIDTGDILLVRPLKSVAQSIDALRLEVDRAQVELLGDVLRYVLTTSALPPRVRQRREDGRQYFPIHRALKEHLEKILQRGDLAVEGATPLHAAE